MNTLFEQLKKGWEDEKDKAFEFEELEQLSRFVALINPENVFDSNAVAYQAGRYQFYFGKALSIRKPLNEEGTEFDPEETAKAEAFEARLANDFATLWKNALFLKNTGK